MVAEIAQGGFLVGSMEALTKGTGNAVLL